MAYFCPHCGEIWGRVVLVDSEGTVRPFDEVFRIACEQHPDQWEIAGSLIGGYRGEELLDYLPPEALKREFEIHLRELER